METVRIIAQCVVNGKHDETEVLEARHGNRD